MSAQLLDSGATVQIDPRLEKYIATRDRRIAKDQPWSPTPLLDEFRQLLSKGEVRVGGRATCGTYRDPSWLIFTSWNEVVRKAVALGYVIEVSPIKHGNGWATKAGGFWNENDYRLVNAENPA
jgi:hypothetical protein